MENSDIKVLKFKEEFKELLKKYNYSISGADLDNGSMTVCDNDTGKDYMMNNWYTNYNLYAEDEEYDLFSLEEQYILDMFRGEPYIDEYKFKLNIGVITTNEHKATSIFNNVHCKNKDNIVNYTSGKDYKVLTLKDGTRYTWIKPNNLSRCRRLGKAYIDKDIDLKILHNVILPLCVYCTKNDVKVI